MSDELNLYAYVGNANRTDPTGETCTQGQGGQYDAERTFYERFVRDGDNALWWEGGNVAPSRRITKWQKDVFSDEFTSAPLHDCSDEKHRCVYGLYRVFAVPRMGLGP